MEGGMVGTGWAHQQTAPGGRSKHLWSRKPRVGGLPGEGNQAALELQLPFGDVAHLAHVVPTQAGGIRQPFSANLCPLSLSTPEVHSAA